MDTAIINHASRLTFLGIEREIRGQVYGYFVTINRSAEYMPGNLLTSDPFDLTLTRVNRQIRAEVLHELKISNLWISLKFICEAGSFAGTEHLRSGLLEYAQPHMSRRHRGLWPEIHKRAVQITVTRDDGSNRTEFPQRIQSQIALFAYSRLAYAHFVQALWNSVDRYQILEVDTRRFQAPNGVSVVETFLVPFATIRNVREASFFIETLNSDSVSTVDRVQERAISTVVWGWKELIGVQDSFRARGRKAFGDKDYVEASYYYGRGYLASTNLQERISRTSPDVPGPFRNLSRSKDCDLLNSVARAINKLVESRRATSPTRAFTAVPLTWMNVAVEMAEDIFWVGMSDHQRKKTHYHRGIAIENRAEYESLHGPTPQRFWPRFEAGDPILPSFEDAARELALALQLKPHDFFIRRALARVDARFGRVTGGDHAPTTRVQLLSGTVWEGDVRLADRWGRVLMTALVDDERRRPDPREVEDLDDHLELE